MLNAAWVTLVAVELFTAVEVACGVGFVIGWTSALVMVLAEVLAVALAAS